MRLSLKSKITAAVGLMMVSSLSGLAFFALTFFESELRETIAAQQFTLVSSLARELDQKIGMAREELVSFARTIPPEMVKDDKALQSFLDRSHHTEPIFETALAIFSPTGTILAMSPYDPAMVGRDFSFRPYFTETVASGEPQISAPFASAQEHGHPIVMFTAPIFDASGSLAAVVGGAVNLLDHNFLGHLASIKLGDSGYLYLYATDRTMIVHPDRSRILQQDVPPGVNRLFDLAIDGFEGTDQTVTSRGLHAFSSFKRLQTRDWILAANYPVTEAFASVENTREVIVVTLVIFTLLALTATWYLMHLFISPLQTLTGCIRELAGDDSPREPVRLKTGDEIGILAEAFNGLLEETENRKRALHDNLAFHQALIETIPVPIWFKDRQGNFIGGNSAFVATFGLDKNTFIGKTVFDIAPRELAAEYNESDNALWRDGGVQVYETKSRRPDGTTRDVVAYKAPFTDSAGNTAGLVGTLLDITERKAIERELADQKDFAINLLQNSPMAGFVIDRRHRIIQWNHACEELTGIPATEILGTDEHWRAFYDRRRPCLADLVVDGNPEDAASIYDQLAAFRLNPDGLQAEGWFPSLRGEERYLVFTAAPIRNQDGEIVAAVETLQDLTDRKKMEQELQGSRDFYLTIFEEFPALIWRAGLDGKCDYFNKTWLNFTGRPLAEELGEGWAEGVHPEDLEDCLATYLGAFEARRSFTMEYRLRRFDGQYRWIVDMGRPFNGLDGRFAGYTGACFDVTDRRQALEQLKILSRSIEQSLNAVIVTSADSRIEYVNPQFTRQTGYTLEEALGKDPDRLLNAGISGALTAEEHQVLIQTLSSGKTWNGEFLNRHKDGSLSWSTATISPIQNDHGEVTHFVSVMADVTEKKALQQSHYRRRLMREAATEALHTFLQTSSHYAMAHVLLQSSLEALQARLGFLGETTAAGLDFLALAGPAYREEDREALETALRHLADGGGTEALGALPRKLGRLLTAPCCLIPLRLADQELGLLGLFGREDGFSDLDRQDLEAFASIAALSLQSARTELARQKATEHLLAVQKFESIGQLAGGVAHDFNNLLTVINGYGSLLVKSLAEDETNRRDAEMILEAGQKAENLTRQLLAFSRRQVLKPVTLDLNHLIGGFRQLLLRLLREDIQVEWRLAPDIERIKADPVQLEQILINLVVNARDAVAAGGRIVIETANAVLDERFAATHPGAVTGAYVMMAVRDTGTGMAAEVRERVFEPFFTTKEPGRGTGLGLSTVYGIVKQSRGYITVESRPGEGSTFRIYFPADDGAVVDQEIPAPTETRGTPTVLLVEDEAEVLQLTTKLLEARGFTVIGTRRPDEAIALLAENPKIDLLLTDMVMPGLSGPELADRLREDRPTLKVLFISGYGPLHGGKISDFAPAGFLQKPFSPETLAAKIMEVLGGA